MTFNRRSDVTLTEMAQWIDSASVSTCDQELLVEYLYHLVLFNAQKRCLFTDNEKFDDFSLFSVSKLLIRLNNNSKEPVKSIVNYIKTVLDPWYAEYVRLFCCGSPELSVQDFDVNDFSDYLIDSTADYDYNSYNFCCINISDAVKQHLKRIPHKKNSSEWSNIYTSCLLTLQDRIESAITLCGNSIATNEPLLLSRVIRELKTKEPILFHLEDSMSSYIAVLVNELVHAIAMELSYSTASKVTPTSCLKSLIIAARSEEDD